jgi:predicted ATPase
VAQICARLDGLPLAIELAAARIKLLPPPALLQRLDRSLTLLTGGARDRPGRQQTLRGTIDWSFSLLTKEEQTLFARLSVFAGGCTIEASEAVCNADGELDLFEGLASLVDKSLIRQDGEDEPRFSMLETIREYAAEKLEASGEGDAVKRRHAEFFLALARSANLTNESEGTMQHGLIIVDRDNVRAALEWARDSGESTLGLQIATALENYWATNSPLEGQHWLGDFLDRATDAPRTLRGQAIRALGGSVDIMGEFERATHLYEASLALYRELDDERGIGIISLRLAVESLRAGDLARARVLLDEALRLDRKTGFKKGEAQAVSTLGMIEAEEGNDEQAFTLLERSIELARETGFTWWQTAMLLELSELFLQRGHLPEAEDRLRQALPLLTHMQDRVNTICALALMAEVAARTGGEERAGTLWGAVEAEEARGPTGQWERERAAYAERVLAHAGPRFETARQTGRRLSLVEAVEVALSDR